MGAFGGRLKEFRLYKNLSQNDFADKCGASQANVTQWETDRNKPSGKIIGIQKAFPDLNIDWLETGEGEMLNKNSKVLTLKDVSSFKSKEYGVGNLIDAAMANEPSALYLTASDKEIMRLKDKIIELQEKLLEAKESKKS